MKIIALICESFNDYQRYCRKSGLEYECIRKIGYSADRKTRFVCIKSKGDVLLYTGGIIDRIEYVSGDQELVDECKKYIRMQEL